MNIDEAILLIKQELERAEKIHPVWPDCMVRKAAYVAEESMELLQAANDYEDNILKTNVHYDDMIHYDNMKIEAVQSAAMAIRFLINM